MRSFKNSFNLLLLTTEFFQCCQAAINKFLINTEKTTAKMEKFNYISFYFVKIIKFVN